MESVMMRVLRTAIPAVLLAAVAAGAEAQQPAPAAGPRLAWINSQAVLANTPGRPEAESLFAREMAGARAEVARLSAELDSALAQYNRASAAMTPALKTQRENELRQMESRNRTRAQELDQSMQSREAELTAPIMQRVSAIIEGVRAEFNYAFIFDVSAQGNPIVAADRAIDITPLVIQRLQAAGPGAAPPSPAATAPADSTRPATPQNAGPRLRPRP